MGAACSNLFSCLDDDGERDKINTGASVKEKYMKFRARMNTGVSVEKLSDGRDKYEVLMKIDDDKKTLVFRFPDSSEDSGLPEDTDPECRPQDIGRISVRRATDPDPQVKEFAGSKILRASLDPQDALKAFILEGVNEDGTQTHINIICKDENDAEELIQGFKTTARKESS